LCRGQVRRCWEKIGFWASFDRIWRIFLDLAHWRLGASRLYPEVSQRCARDPPRVRFLCLGIGFRRAICPFLPQGIGRSHWECMVPCIPNWPLPIPCSKSCPRALPKCLQNSPKVSWELSQSPPRTLPGFSQKLPGFSQKRPKSASD